MVLCLSLFAFYVLIFFVGRWATIYFLSVTLLLWFGNGLLVGLVGIMQLLLWTIFVLCCLDYVNPLRWIICDLWVVHRFFVWFGRFIMNNNNKLPSVLHYLFMIHADLWILFWNFSGYASSVFDRTVLSYFGIPPFFMMPCISLRSFGTPSAALG